ncbi:MAG: glycosyltransferase family 39 protein [Candidatus Sumerlaeota bacterium]|nr:glycosyltransferase family 39 protein [Candidatus Sumerlaeota bacterium]
MPSAFRWSDDRPFVFLFLAVAAAWGALLVMSQWAVHGDEAVVGIMAKHIVEKGARPIFCYGAQYNGGSAVTAYLATISFALFGMSEIALKLVPLTLNLLGVLVVYGFVRSARGPRDALFAALIYATSISLLKWRFDARGAYAESQVTIPLALWILRSRCLKAVGGNALDFFLLGLLCGFGFYVLELFAPTIVVVVICLFARDKLFFARRTFWVWIAGLTIGLSPLIYYNLTEHFANLGHIIEKDRRTQIGAGPFAHLPYAPLRLWRALAHDLPGMMSYDNLYVFPERIGASNWIEYGVLLAAVVGTAWWRRAEIGVFLRSLASRRIRNEPAEPVALEAILLLYVAVYVAAYALHPLAGENSRHLLFLEPAVSILIGLAFAHALRTVAPGSRRGIRLAALALLTLTLADRGWQYVQLMCDDRVHGAQGKINPRNAEDLIAFLDQYGIDRAVVLNYDLRWRIVFLTRERIIAANIPGLFSRYPPYEDELRRSNRYALVVPADPAAQAPIDQSLAANGIPRHAWKVRDMIVYLDLPPVWGTAGAG